MSAPLLTLSLCAVLAPLLAIVVIASRVRRSRFERVSGLRRARYESALRAGCGRELRSAFGEARRGRGRQEDLIRALDGEGGHLAKHAICDVARSARRSGLEGTLERQCASRWPVRRGRAIRLLCGLRLPSAVRCVAPLVSDRDIDVRITAVAGLASLKTREAARALIDALGEHALPPERIAERIGEPWAGDTLLEAYGRADISAIRPWIVEALGLAGETRALTQLLTLAADGDDEERVCAARALGRLGLREAEPQLVAGLDDPFAPVRAQAARALRGIAGAMAVPALEHRLTDESWWVRANCADTLRAAGPLGLDALGRAITHEDRFARDRAAEALALELANAWRAHR